jgi:hypothetical protein
VSEKLPNVPKAPKGAVFTLEAPKAVPVNAVEPEAAVEKPQPVRKNVKTEEQPHFGRSA